MPSIDSPEIRKGFWLTVGVILAFVAVALIRMLISGVRGGKRSRP